VAEVGEFLDHAECIAIGAVRLIPWPEKEQCKRIACDVRWSKAFCSYFPQAHSECRRSSIGKVEHATLDKRSPIVDLNQEAFTGSGIRHAEDRAKRECAVGGCELVHVEALPMGCSPSVERMRVIGSDAFKDNREAGTLQAWLRERQFWLFARCSDAQLREHCDCAGNRKERHGRNAHQAGIQSPPLHS